MFEAAHCKFDVEQTLHAQHAIEIAERLDIEAYDGVVCCSGDGVLHEVFNGLFKRDDAARALRKIALCQLPGGSGNAMCWNLTGTSSASLATVAIIKGWSCIWSILNLGTRLIWRFERKVNGNRWIWFQLHTATVTSSHSYLSPSEWLPR